MASGHPILAAHQLQPADGWLVSIRLRLGAGSAGGVAEESSMDLYDQYNADGNWVGCLSPGDVAGLDTTTATELTGPAGSLTIHNCRMLHSSMPNRSAQPRPLLLNAYSSADAMPYTPVPTESKYYQHIVRGQPARWAHHDERPCQIPPDWSGGYTSIFALQQEEAM